MSAMLHVRLWDALWARLTTVFMAYVLLYDEVFAMLVACKDETMQYIALHNISYLNVHVLCQEFLLARMAQLLHWIHATLEVCRACSVVTDEAGQLSPMLAMRCLLEKTQPLDFLPLVSFVSFATAIVILIYHTAGGAAKRHVKWDTSNLNSTSTAGGKNGKSQSDAGKAGDVDAAKRAEEGGAAGNRSHTASRTAAALQVKRALHMQSSFREFSDGINAQNNARRHNNSNSNNVVGTPLPAVPSHAQTPGALSAVTMTPSLLLPTRPPLPVISPLSVDTGDPSLRSGSTESVKAPASGDSFASPAFPPPSAPSYSNHDRNISSLSSSSSSTDRPRAAAKVATPGDFHETMSVLSFGNHQQSGDDDVFSVMSKTDTHLHNTHGQGQGQHGTARSRGTVTVRVNGNNDGYADFPEAAAAMQSSVEQPGVLIGWRISVPGRGKGLVLSVHKKKFRSTHFQVQFDGEPGRSALLPLQRSSKKGSVPFKLISRLA